MDRGIALEYFILLDEKLEDGEIVLQQSLKPAESSKPVKLFQAVFLAER